MSADNYLYVAPRGKKFVIVDRSASCDYRLNIAKYERSIEEHDSAVTAVARAHHLDQGDHWTEYGVSLHPRVMEALDAASNQERES